MTNNISEILFESIQKIVDKTIQENEANKNNSSEDNSVFNISATNPLEEIVQYETKTNQEITLSPNAMMKASWDVAEWANYDRFLTSFIVTVNGSAEGDYGLKYTFKGNNKIKTLTYTSDDMLGDPFVFDSMLQRSIFDISDVKFLQVVDIEFYNNTNQNITFSDIFFSIGYNVTTYSENDIPLTLFGKNGLTEYQSNSDGELVSTSEEVLCVRFVYPNDESYKAITQANATTELLTKERVTIKWYRHSPSAATGDQWGGAYWVLQSTPEKNPFQMSIKDFDPNLEEEKFKVVILHNDFATNQINEYTSNEIVIKNKQIDLTQGNQLRNQQIILGDNSNGYYYYYGPTGYLRDEDSAQASVIRKASLSYSLIDLSKQKADFINQVVKTTWKIPREEFNLFTAEEEAFDEEEYKCYSWSGYQKEIEYTLSRKHNPAVKAKSIIAILEMKDGTSYEFSHDLRLGFAGSNGSSYAISIQLLDDDDNPRIAIINGETLKLDINLFNSDGTKSDLKPNVVQLINENTADGNYNITEDAQGDRFLSFNGSLVTDSINYLKVVYNVGGEEGKELSISACYGIALTADETINYIGPREVIYDHTGSNPIFSDKQIYILQDGKKINPSSLYAANDSLPTLNNNYLRPKASLSAEALGANAAIVFEGKFIQPIIISQNRYPSKLINEWDGALQINEKGNYIMSSAFVAGEKNNQNQFTGVIAGTLGTIVDKKENPEAESGIFGYRAGAQSFGLRTDGTAFFGTSNSGRIEFDGNNGLIQSGNYKNGNIDYTSGLYYYYSNGLYYEVNKDNHSLVLGKLIYDKNKQLVVNKETGTNMVYSENDGPKAGLKIDLDEGVIDGLFFRLDNSGASIEGQIKVSDGGNIGNWYVGTPTISIPNESSELIIAGLDSYTNSLYTVSGTYKKTNLYTTVLSGDENSSYPRMAVYLNKYNNDTGEYADTSDVIFSVNGEGRLFAKDADIEGKVISEEGNIGGWTVSGKQLSAGSDTNFMALNAATYGEDPAGNSEYFLWAGSETAFQAPFNILKNGRVTAENGSIGGWEVGKNLISSGVNKSYVALSAKGDYALWAGDEDASKANFTLSPGGQINIRIPEGKSGTEWILGQGRIHTANGQVGMTGWTFSGDGLTNDQKTIRIFAGLPSEKEVDYPVNAKFWVNESGVVKLTKAYIGDDLMLDNNALTSKIAYQGEDALGEQWLSRIELGNSKFTCGVYDSAAESVSLPHLIKGIYIDSNGQLTIKKNAKYAEGSNQVIFQIKFNDKTLNVTVGTDGILRAT